MKLLIFLIRPDVYEKMEEEDTEEVEMAGLTETTNEDGETQTTMGTDDFNLLVKKREGMLGNEFTVLSRTIDGEEQPLSETPFYNHNPISVTHI